MPPAGDALKKEVDAQLEHVVDHIGGANAAHRAEVTSSAEQLLQGERRVDIGSVVLEQDTARSIMRDVSVDGMDGGAVAVLDMNRSGVGLIEIVTPPCIRSPMDTLLFLRTIQMELKARGISEGDMSKGQMRADINISVASVPKYTHGDSGAAPIVSSSRVEVKNLNSARHAAQAVHVEAQRHVACHGQNESETRSFDVVTSATRPLRRKEREGIADYRFSSEPDLPCLLVTDADIDRIKASMPSGLLERDAALAAHLGMERGGLAAARGASHLIAGLSQRAVHEWAGHLDEGDVVPACSDVSYRGSDIGWNASGGVSALRRLATDGEHTSFTYLSLVRDHALFPKEASATFVSKWVNILFGTLRAAQSYEESGKGGGKDSSTAEETSIRLLAPGEVAAGLQLVSRGEVGSQLLKQGLKQACAVNERRVLPAILDDLVAEGCGVEHAETVTYAVQLVRDHPTQADAVRRAGHDAERKMGFLLVA